MPIRYLSGLSVDSTVLVVDAANDRVGIGTASPASKLDVFGNVKFGAYSISNGDIDLWSNSGGIHSGSSITWRMLTSGGNPNSAIAKIQPDVYNPSRGYVNALDFYVGDWNNNNNVGSALMSIMTSGNVGFGTLTPNSKIEIGGTTGSYNSGIGFVPSGTGARNYRTFISTNGSFNFDDATAGATRINISSTGNVGIGTTSPTYKLQVEGAGRFNNNQTGAPSVSTNNSNATDDAAISNLNFDGNRLRLGVLASDGAYGAIGSNGGTTGLAFVTHNGSVWSEKMRITPAGNVGIGNTAADGFKLDVSGTGRFTSAITGQQGLSISGYGALFNSANKFVLDFYNGNSRLYSMGTDASTKGGFEFHTNSSDGSLDVIALGIASTGAATFSSTVAMQGLTATTGNFTGALTGTSATFSSSVTATELLINNSIPKITLTPLTYSGSYRTILGTRTGAEGVLQLGNNSDNFIVGGNTGTGGNLKFYVNANSDFITSTNGTLALTLASTGAATFSSTAKAKGLIAYGASGGYTTSDNPFVNLANDASADTFGAINHPFGDKMRFNAYHGFSFRTSNNGASATPTEVASISSTGAATFSGNVGITVANTPELLLTHSNTSRTFLMAVDGSNAFFRANSTNNILFQVAGGTTALTLASTQAATFSSSVTATSFVKTSGTSAQYLMADGSVSTLTNPVTGTGTTNYIAKFTGANSIGNSLIYDDGTTITFQTGASERLRITSAGNVGIGTTAPATLLSLGAYSGSRLPYINGTVNTFNLQGITVTSSNTANAAIGGGIDLTNNVHSVGSFSPLISFSALSQSGTYNNNYAAIYGILAGAGGDANWNTGHIVFATADSYGASEKMRLNASGNLSVGNTNDTYKLDVSGTGRFTGALTGTSATFSSSVTIGASSTSNYGTINDVGVFNNVPSGGSASNPAYYGGIRFTGGGYDWGAIRTIQTNPSASWLNRLAFFTQNGAGGAALTERMAIDNSGNVGIGTTNTDPLSLGRERNLAIVTTGTNATLTLVGGVAGRIDFGVSTTRTAGIYSDATNYTEIFTSTALPLVFSTNSTEKMRITSTGNVGIGTTAPQTKLQIEGSGGTLAGTAAISFGDSNSNSSRNWAISNGASARGIDQIGALSISRSTASGGNPLTAGVEVARFTSVGFDVNGEVSVSPNTAGKNTFVLTTNASNDGRLLIKSDTTTKVDIQANGASYFSGGNVGIGETAPSEKLHVDGSTLVTYNNSFQSTNSVGNKAILARVSPTSGIINYAEYATAANLNGFVIGSDDARVKGNITGDSLEFITNTSTRMTILSSGNVGINTTTPGSTLHVIGDVLIQTGALGVGVNPNATDGRIDASNDIVAFSTSDRRLKENITPITNALEKVRSLTGVEFDWKEETKSVHGYEGHDVGVIAQDVQAVLPEAVRTNDSGYLSVRYEKMIALLVEANKELADRVEQLEKLIK